VAVRLNWAKICTNIDLPLTDYVLRTLLDVPIEDREVVIELAAGEADVNEKTGKAKLTAPLIRKVITAMGYGKQPELVTVVVDNPEVIKPKPKSKVIHAHNPRDIRSRGVAISPLLENDFPTQKRGSEHIQPKSASFMPRILSDPMPFTLLPSVLATPLTAPHSFGGDTLKIHLRQPQSLQMSTLRTACVPTLTSTALYASE
jgi:hypothetical protein